MAATTSKKIREQNQERIYRLFRRCPEQTKQDIAAELQLSMPTTLQNVNDLLERGILEECGEKESTGGRKPKQLRLRRNLRYSVGIDIAVHDTELVLTDFGGQPVAYRRFPQAFRDEPEWYRELHTQLEKLLTENSILHSQVIGAGLSFPGIVDPKADRIVRSHILRMADVSLEQFHQAVPFPLIINNDANCAGFAERSAEMESYQFISLNESVGGAIMYHGQLLSGDRYQTGEFGHMLLFPNGRQCYCGKHGCADPYLSPNALAENGGTLTEFFDRIEQNSQTWDEYLEALAMLVTNLRMARDIPIIIGGTVGAAIEPYMQQLREKAAKYDLFAVEIDYLYPCRVKSSACAIGAARLALEQFGAEVLQIF